MAEDPQLGSRPLPKIVICFAEGKLLVMGHTLPRTSGSRVGLLHGQPEAPLFASCLHLPKLPKTCLTWFGSPGIVV